MASNHKGHRRERELMDKLIREGMIVHRVAGSGRGEDAICDLIAVDTDGIPHFIEVKSRKKVFYTKQHLGQLNAIINAANKCNAKPVLAVKLNYKPWIVLDLNEGIPVRI